MNFKKNLKIVRAITMCLALGTMGCINMNMVSASDNLQAPKSAFDKNYKPDMSRGADNFYQSDKVNMQKVEFKNQYNMTVVGNLFVPKNLAQNEKAPAIIVGHPMGAVKEQSANLYATKMAEQGFVTLAMDLSFWGESEGLPRNSVSPDIYAPHCP